MGLFTNSNHEAHHYSEPKPVEPIEMLVEYHDSTRETITITFNLEELEQLVGNSLSTGASMNFATANPPFFINPRWIKKITFRKATN